MPAVPRRELAQTLAGARQWSQAPLRHRATTNRFPCVDGPSTDTRLTGPDPTRIPACVFAEILPVRPSACPKIGIANERTASAPSDGRLPLMTRVYLSAINDGLQSDRVTRAMALMNGRPIRWLVVAACVAAPPAGLAQTSVVRTLGEFRWAATTASVLWQEVSQNRLVVQVRIPTGSVTSAGRHETRILPTAAMEAWVLLGAGTVLEQMSRQPPKGAAPVGVGNAGTVDSFVGFSFTLRPDRSPSPSPSRWRTGIMCFQSWRVRAGSTNVCRRMINRHRRQSCNLASSGGRSPIAFKR